MEKLSKQVKKSKWKVRKWKIANIRKTKKTKTKNKEISYERKLK